MRNYIPFIAFCFVLLSPFYTRCEEAGDLISEQILMEMNETGIRNLYTEMGVPELLFPIEYEVVMYKIVYLTNNPRDNSLALASGLITVPVGEDCSFPVLNYNHGSLNYDVAISDLNTSNNQHFIGIPFSAGGYITVIPDYLGFAASPVDIVHPYMHARSSATSVINMLKAARILFESIGVQWNEELYLLGYSQGGFVTMATHREIESSFSNEFSVTASAPCSGPYDLSGGMRDSVLFSRGSFSDPRFFGRVITSYEYVYGNIYDRLSDVFISPYDTIIAHLYDRSDPQTFWEDSLPYPGVNMIQPGYLDAVVNDPQHPVNVALRDNDVYDWIPEAPVRIIYCEADEQIPYVNALFTRDHMTSLGAQNVTAVSGGAILDHGGCVYPALINAKLWFDTFRDECASTAITEAPEKEENTMFYPNPFTDRIQLKKQQVGNERNLLEVYDIHGRKIRQQWLENDVITWSGEALLPGTYIFVLHSPNGRYVQKMIRE